MSLCHYKLVSYFILLNTKVQIHNNSMHSHWVWIQHTKEPYMPIWTLLLNICFFGWTRSLKHQALTGNTWPCHIVSGCVRTPRRSSTSARCRGHSRVPHDQLCHSYSNTALSPFWVPYSLWKYGHSCGNCSTLYLKQKKIINKLCRWSTNCTKSND